MVASEVEMKNHYGEEKEGIRKEKRDREEGKGRCTNIYDDKCDQV